MKLSWADSSTQLFLGNAKNLDQIKDSSVDMVLTDPPYGINYVTGHRERGPNSKSVVATLERFNPIVDDDSFPTVLLTHAIWEMQRILKPNTALYMFTRWDCYHKLLPLFNGTGLEVRNVLTWAKNNWSAGNLTGNYAYQTEIILYATKGKHILRGHRDSNLLCFKRIDGAKLLHPAQKPEGLLSFLITKSCPPDGIVLDPFVGCGTTCVAAANVGRKSIGVDIDDKWLKLAQRRLEHKYLPMFETAEVAPQNFALYFEEENYVPID